MGRYTTIGVNGEVYVALLHKKHEYEDKERRRVSFGETILRLIKETK